MADLNIYEPSFPTFSPIKDAPSTAEVIGLSSKQTIMPMINSYMASIQYGGKPDPNFRWQDNVKGYEQFASTLSSAVSADHMAALKQQIDSSFESKQRLSEATLGQSLIGEIFNPINYIALPFGGPATSYLGSIGKAALQTGATQALVEAMIVQPFDATATAEESAMNIVTTSLFGGGIAAALGARGAITYKNTQKAISDFGTMSERLDNLQGITPEVYNSRQPRDQRAYGALPDTEIKTNVYNLEGQAKALRDQSEASPELKDQADALEAEAKGYRNELGFRALEDNKINLADPYSILPSAFTDSILFKAVTTPMKRTLQGPYPTAVKEKFVKLANDNGITMLMNSFGIAAEPSVYLRTAVEFGKIAKAHDELIALWAADTNASPKSLIDLNASDLARRATRSPDTYGRWLEMVSEKRMKGITAMSENELKASSIINDYFENASKNLEDVGLIGTKRSMEMQINKLNNEIESLNVALKSAAGDPRKTSVISRRLSKLESDKKFREIEFAASGEVKATEPFFPRFFDQSAIKANRQEFSDILFRWYQENPNVWELDYTTKQWTQKNLSTRPEDIQARVDTTIDKILGIKDPTALEDVNFGVGRSKHFRNRELDIPNSLVTKFIMRDPLAVMKTYSARIEPRYQFEKMFGKDYDGVLHDIELEMLNGNMTDEQINKVRRDFDVLYRRVAGNVLDNPSALNQKIAYFLREGASFAYMGGAGLASIPDFGRIVMEYDLESIVKGVQTLIDRETVKMTVDQVRYAGEAVDILKQSAHMRIQEDLGTNFQASPLLNSARNIFYIVNGLAPITSLSKQLAGIVDAHTIIDYSIKLSKGSLDDQSRIWLARHGIDEDFAKIIARAPWQTTKNGLYVSNTDDWTDSIFIPEIDNKRVTVIEANEDGSPVGKQRGNRYIPAFYNHETKTITFDRDFIEGQMFEEKGWLDPKVEGVKAMPDIFKTPKQWANFVMLHEINHSRFRPKDLGIDELDNVAYENKINDLALEEYRAQTTINAEAADRFRTALNSGVLNTIISGTPADKPIITDGVVYLPIRIAKSFGFKEDARVKGYARIENGFLGLPFQFYSFMFGSVNKTVAAFAHGQIKNRAIGSAVMLGLAYMTLKYKTSDATWQNMDMQDKLARTIDSSGLLSIYSDLFYTTMHTTLALGGPNITGGFISPKFKQDKGAADAIFSLAGAGPNWAKDLMAGIYSFAAGDYAGGGRDIVRNLPGSNIWFLKSEINQITRGWGN